MKKNAIRLFSLILSAAVLGGCGTGEGETTAATQPAAEVTTQATTEATTEAATAPTTEAATETTQTPETTETQSSENGNYITEEEALAIARDYWSVEPGEVDPETGFPMTIEVQGTPTDDYPMYTLALRWLVEESHWSTLDSIQIDAVTGEIF